MSYKKGVLYWEKYMDSEIDYENVKEFGFEMGPGGIMAKGWDKFCSGYYDSKDIYLRRFKEEFFQKLNELDIQLNDGCFYKTIDGKVYDLGI